MSISRVPFLLRAARPQNASRPLAAALCGLAVPFLTPFSARAQRIADLPKLLPVPMATDADIRKLGVVQGDVVIPYSNLKSPGDAGVRLHTNYQILRRAAMEAEGLPSTPMMTFMSLSLVSPVSLPITLPWVGMRQPALTGSGPSGAFLPADLKKAYNLPATGGAGTIVLIGAYQYAAALSDFNMFSSYTGLPTEPSTNATLNTNKVFQVVYASGRPPIVDSTGSTTGEAALDIEWAHAMAPNAKIVLVLANSTYDYDLIYGAVTKANNLPGVREVSISYGGDEFATQTTEDAVFTKQGIVYFASSGDSGGQIEWPSSSPNIVAVGGTSLVTNSSTQAVVSETGWGVSNGSAADTRGSGGGVSAYETKPSYQASITYGGTTPINRAVPDVSLVADPQTGVLVFFNGKPYIFGGTSLSSPAVAGITNLSLSNRTSSVAELTYIYSIYNNATAYSANYRDITMGTASSMVGSTTYSNSCFVGYDLVTGIGSPLGIGGL